MNFQIFVYDHSGGIVGLAANVIGEGNDVSYHRGAGDYYLTMNGAQSFQVTVEAKY